VNSQPHLDEIADLLCSGPAFEGMPKSIALRIAEKMLLRKFKQGEHLTLEGSSNEGLLMLVITGMAEISSRNSKDGGHLVHRIARPGHIIGEVGFIDGMPHSASCLAVDDTYAAILERSVFLQMFDQDARSAGQLMAGLLRLLAKRIRHANAYMLAQDEQILQLQTQMLRMRSVPAPL
jgi:CRP/FNR family transcriptional regulator, cyclic AMP receptor protein